MTGIMIRGVDRTGSMILDSTDWEVLDVVHCKQYSIVATSCVKLVQVQDLSSPGSGI